jgi:ERF superfamily
MSTTAIEKALFEAWKDFPTIKKDAKNDFANFKYAKLETIEEAIKPHLAKHGIRYSYLQKNSGQDGKIIVSVAIRIVHHESGEVMESEFFSLAVKTRPGAKTGEIQPQDVMSYLSYLKRYSLTGFLGITTEDEDLDESTGQKNQSPPPIKAEPKMLKAPPIQPASIPPKEPAKIESPRAKMLNVMKEFIDKHGKDAVFEALDISDSSVLRSWDDTKLQAGIDHLNFVFNAEPF